MNETLFFDLHDAQTKIAVWVAYYNGQRPHSSLQYLKPAAYAATFTQRALGCATPTSSADRPLLHPRHMAYKKPRL